MKVLIDKSFEKDTDKIKDKKILLQLAENIEHIQVCTSLSEIPNLKKLKGFKYHFRIRMGDYRAGIVIKNNVLIFERFLHRKDIYKYYP